MRMKEWLLPNHQINQAINRHYNNIILFPSVKFNIKYFNDYNIISFPSVKFNIKYFNDYNITSSVL